MKKQYSATEIEFISSHAEDVITTSLTLSVWDVDGEDGSSLGDLFS